LVENVELLFALIDRELDAVTRSRADQECVLRTQLSERENNASSHRHSRARRLRVGCRPATAGRVAGGTGEWVAREPLTSRVAAAPSRFDQPDALIRTPADMAGYRSPMCPPRTGGYVRSSSTSVRRA